MPSTLQIQKVIIWEWLDTKQCKQLHDWNSKMVNK